MTDEKMTEELFREVIDTFGCDWLKKSKARDSRGREFDRIPEFVLNCGCCVSAIGLVFFTKQYAKDLANLKKGRQVVCRICQKPSTGDYIAIPSDHLGEKIKYIQKMRLRLSMESVVNEKTTLEASLESLEGEIGKTLNLLKQSRINNEPNYTPPEPTNPSGNFFKGLLTSADSTSLPQNPFTVKSIHIPNNPREQKKNSIDFCRPQQTIFSNNYTQSEPDKELISTKQSRKPSINQLFNNRDTSEETNDLVAPRIISFGNAPEKFFPPQHNMALPETRPKEPSMFTSSRVKPYGFFDQLTQGPITTKVSQTSPHNSQTPAIPLPPKSQQITEPRNLQPAPPATSSMKKKCEAVQLSVSRHIPCQSFWEDSSRRSMFRDEGALLGSHVSSIADASRQNKDYGLEGGNNYFGRPDLPKNMSESEGLLGENLNKKEKIEEKNYFCAKRDQTKDQKLAGGCIGGNRDKKGSNDELKNHKFDSDSYSGKYFTYVFDHQIDKNSAPTTNLFGKTTSTINFNDFSQQARVQTQKSSNHCPPAKVSFFNTFDIHEESSSKNRFLGQLSVNERSERVSADSSFQKFSKPEEIKKNEAEKDRQDEYQGEVEYDVSDEEVDEDSDNEDKEDLEKSLDYRSLFEKELGVRQPIVNDDAKNISESNSGFFSSKIAIKLGPSSLFSNENSNSRATFKSHSSSSSFFSLSNQGQK